MALRGTLGDFSLTDILQLIGLQRKTGRLVLRRGEEEITVGVDNGRVVSAESSLRPAEQRIGQLLVRTGALTEDRLEEAIRRQKATLQRLGHVLVERGWVDRETLQRQLGLQITDTIYDLFRWKDGEYDFHPGPVDWDRAFIEPIPSENLLMEGARMLDEWPMIERVIPARMALKMTPGAASLLAMSPEDQEARGSVYEQDMDFGFIPADPLADKGPKTRFTDRERRVLRWVNGRRTATEIAELSGLGSFECFHLMAALVKGGFLEALPLKIDGKEEERAPGVLRSAAPARILAAAVVLLAVLGVGSGVQETLRALFPGPRILPASSPIASAGALAEMASLEQLRRSVSAARLDRIEEALSVHFLDQGGWPRTLSELAGWGLAPRRFIEDPWGQSYRFEMLPWGYRVSETMVGGRAPWSGSTGSRPWSGRPPDSPRRQWQRLSPLNLDDWPLAS